MTFPFICCPMNREYYIVNSTLQDLRTEIRCLMDDERLESFMTEVPIIQKLGH